MATFNEGSGNNTEVPYTLIAGSADIPQKQIPLSPCPTVMELLHPIVGGGLDTDLVVFYPSSLGYTISLTDWHDNSHAGSVFKGNRKIIRLPAAGKIVHMEIGGNFGKLAFGGVRNQRRYDP